MLRIVKNMCIQIRYAQFYTIIHKYTVKCYEHTKMIYSQLPDIAEEWFCN